MKKKKKKEKPLRSLSHDFTIFPISPTTGRQRDSINSGDDTTNTFIIYHLRRTNRKMKRFVSLPSPSSLDDEISRLCATRRFFAPR